MARTKVVDGVVMDFTPEDQAQWDADEKEFVDGKPAREMEDIRRERNSLLTSTDWTANFDVTMSDAMKTYRQALRDIPASNTIFKDVTWPTKPE